MTMTGAEVPIWFRPFAALAFGVWSSHIQGPALAVERAIDSILSTIGAYLFPLFVPLPGIISKVFPAYWNFVSRPMPLTTTTGFDALGYEYFFYLSCKWTVVFCGLHLFVNALCRQKRFASWWQGLSAEHRRDFSTYTVVMVHHVYVVPRSWWRMYSDYQVRPEDFATMDYGPLDSIVSPILTGYLIADTIFYALPQKSIQYLIHHTVTMAIVLGGNSGNNYLTRFIPHLLVSDTTQLLYNTSWILKRFGWKDNSPICLTLEILFAVMFPIVRVFIMPVAFLRVGIAETLGNPNEQTLAKEGMRLGRFSFLPLFIMQLYWYSLVLTRVVGLSLIHI